MMPVWEQLSFWGAVFGYVVAFILMLIGMVRDRDRLTRFGYGLVLVGGAAHVSAFVARWLASGHVPVTDAYELNLTGTLISTALLLGLDRLRRLPRLLFVVILPATFLVLGYGVINRSEPAPMGPAFNSPWLLVHVLFAWLAFGGFVAAAAASAFLLLKVRRPDSVRLARLPSPDVLDGISYRMIVIGFICHAIMLVSGAIWAKALWGHYWNWDALETWSLLTFLFYAFLLHARAFLGWKRERAAWLSALGLLILSISFWGVGWFSATVHPGP